MKSNTFTTKNSILALSLLMLGAPSVLFAGSQSFSTSGTFTVPASVTQIFVTGSGQGGCGYQASACYGGGGGGSGGHVENMPITVTPGTSYPVTIQGVTSLGSLSTLTKGQDATGRTGASGGSPGGVSGQNGSVDQGCQYNPVNGGGGGSGGSSQISGSVGNCTGPNAYDEMDCVNSESGQNGGGGAGGGGVWYAGRSYTYSASCGGTGFLDIAWVDATVGTVSVSSNIAEASWTITGPSAISGSGVSASYSSKPTGSYTITWGSVPGYTTPNSETFTLSSGGTISFSGVYVTPPSVSIHFSQLWQKFKDLFVDNVFAGGI